LLPILSDAGTVARMSDPEAVVQQHIDAWNAHDADADPWSEDAVFTTPDGTELNGRDEVLGFGRSFWTAFPDSRLEVVTRIAEGNIVMTEGRLIGTHDGPLATPDGEVPATGRTLDVGWMCVQEVRGDEVISENLYFNQLQFLGQLGLLEDAAT
jgi:steroid delta-isomerase-like uncharacterized protein